MSEATHTPGPWHLHPSGKPNCLDTYTVFHGHGERLDNQICAADLGNARLIAAAPDLLAAAIAAHKRLADSLVIRIKLTGITTGALADEVKQLGAAIAKAAK